MPNNDSFQLSDPRRKQQHREVLDFNKILNYVSSKWYYFIFALLVAFIFSWLYIKYTIPVYKVSATILINEEKIGVTVGNNQIFEGFGLGAGATNLDNQRMLLSSKTLIGRTIDELRLDIEYYYKGLLKKKPLYPDPPIRVLPENVDSLPRDTEFTFKYLDNKMFNLKTSLNGTAKLDTIISFDNFVRFSEFRFMIEQQSNEMVGQNRKLYFMNHDRKKLIDSYKKRIKVEPASKNGTIINVSLEGANRIMDTDFLAKLIEIFLNNSLDKKNQEAIRTIQFIDDQLIGISDSLIITETRLQQFRSQHRVMDLSAQGQVIIDQAMSLDNEKARLGIEANYYNYLADYLAKDNVGQAPIAPATIGITDPGLTRLVTELADIQGQIYNKSLGEKNPLQSQLAQRLRNTKNALMETLNGVRRANNLALAEITDQIRTVNAQASALPVTERQLLGIERKFKLNDELYTFLLEKRAEAQIQKASNIPDNEIIDPPEFEISPVSPNKGLTFALAILSGIFLPFFLTLIIGKYDNKVRNDQDLSYWYNLPLIGDIPHFKGTNNDISLLYKNPISIEAFRSLRSRINNLTKGIKSPVILITSSIPNEGKTYLAVNLALAFNLMNKKTIIVDFDLRQPNAHSFFNQPNETGITSWYNGEKKLENIIQKTEYGNLDLIPSGPETDNPAELILFDDTKELLQKLKSNYDYIIFDSSPAGTVSDSFHLAELADISLLIIRSEMTFLSSLDKTIKELKERNLVNLCLVINDIRDGSRKFHNAVNSQVF